MSFPFTKPDWPHITTDNIEYRTWVHPEPPNFYLHRYPDDSTSGHAAGKWVVIDRRSDSVISGFYKRRADCIKAFLREGAEKARKWEQSILESMKA
jgi:hypothetical protein